MVRWATGIRQTLHRSNCISIAHFLENFITFIVFVPQRQELLHRKVCFLSQPSFEMTG